LKGFIDMKLNSVLGLGLVTPLLFAACNSDTTARKEKAAAQSAVAAQQVYVPPGKLDEYYAILSGGQSGSVFV
jgi:nitrous oxide reductase